MVAGARLQILSQVADAIRYAHGQWRPDFPYQPQPAYLPERALVAERASGAGVNLSLLCLTLLDLASDISDIKSVSASPSLPLPAAYALRKLGRELALARRKRGISTDDMAARLFVSRDTLWRMERGDPKVATGTLATAAFILQLHERLANVASPGDDSLGLNLDEQRLRKRIRRPKA